jgi:ATP-dependent exoDNAse (exonuclease V) beta subunit
MICALNWLLMKEDRKLVLWYPLGSHSRSGTIGYAHYSHVFIDEAQDVNEAQLAMFLMMNESERYSSNSDNNTQSKPPIMYMIGDPLQSLYQFRGCTNSIEQLVHRIPADERNEYVYTLSNSFRFGNKIAAVVNTYLQNSMYPGMLSRYEKRLTASNTYTNTAVIAPCTDTIVTGAAAYDGIILSANSSSDNNDNAELQIPYTILCASNKGVLEAAMSVLNLDDLLSKHVTRS